MSCLSLRFLQLKIGNDWKKDKNARSTDVADLGVSELLGVFMYLHTFRRIKGNRGHNTFVCQKSPSCFYVHKTGPVGQQRKAERKNRKALDTGRWRVCAFENS